MSFLKKDERKQCYASRDQYWECMDQHEGKDEKLIHQQCKQFREMFFQHCPAQWVTHFERKYKYLKFKQMMDTGYDPLDGESIHNEQHQQQQQQQQKQ